jgi:hypothetical protein
MTYVNKLTTQSRYEIAYDKIYSRETLRNRRERRCGEEIMASRAHNIIFICSPLTRIRFVILFNMNWFMLFLFFKFTLFLFFVIPSRILIQPAKKVLYVGAFAKLTKVRK